MAKERSKEFNTQIHWQEGRGGIHGWRYAGHHGAVAIGNTLCVSLFVRACTCVCGCV